MWISAFDCLSYVNQLGSHKETLGQARRQELDEQRPTCLRRISGEVADPRDTASSLRFFLWVYTHGGAGGV